MTATNAQTLSPERLRLLHGTADPPAPMRALRAGPVSLLLDGIDLRYLRIGGTELVRRVRRRARRRLGHRPRRRLGLEVEDAEDGFRVEFDARHARRDIDFSWHGTIAGDPSGRVEVVFDGQANGPLAYNRIGLCVHHPWRETKGRRTGRGRRTASSRGIPEI